MKKILFFTCEPGGAEVLIPVIKLLNTINSYEVIVLSYGFANDRFEKQNIDFNLIEPIKKNEFFIFEHYSPDIIITSATSLPQKDMSEKYLWYNAKKQNIKTIAFLDQWQNYAIRFSGVNKNERLIYQPDFINCINSIGKKEMIAEGFDSDKLLELGQPYLDSLANKEVEVLNICKDLKLSSNKKVLLFVSESIEEHFGNDRGYTQYEVIDYLLTQEFVQDKNIIIKLHPKDDINKFKKYDNLILLHNEYSMYELIEIADYVIGMTSIALIEAYTLKKKVLSIQLNSNNDLMILSKYKLINKIVDSKLTINDEYFNNIYYDNFNIFFSEEDILRLISKLLNDNSFNLKRYLFKDAIKLHLEKGNLIREYGIRYLPIYTQNKNIKYDVVDYVFVIGVEYVLIILNSIINSLIAKQIPFVILGPMAELEKYKQYQQYYYSLNKFEHKSSFDYKNDLGQVNQDRDYLVKYISNRYNNILNIFKPKVFVTMYMPAVDYPISIYNCIKHNIPSIAISHAIGENDKHYDTKYLLADYRIMFSKLSYKNLNNSEYKQNYISKLHFSAVHKAKYLKRFNKNLVKDENVILVLSQYVTYSGRKIVFDTMEKIYKFMINNREYKFLIKPHPLEDITHLQKRFRKYKHIVVIDDLTVSLYNKYRPLMSLSFMTSSFFEYAYLGIVPIAFASKSSEDYSLSTFGHFAECGEDVFTYAELTKMIRKIKKYKYKYIRNAYKIGKTLIMEKSINNAFSDIVKEININEE